MDQHALAQLVTELDDALSALRALPDADGRVTLLDSTEGTAGQV